MAGFLKKVGGFVKDKLIPAASMGLSGNIGGGIGLLFSKKENKTLETKSGGTMTPSGIVLAAEGKNGLEKMVYDADKKGYVAVSESGMGAIPLIGLAVAGLLLLKKR